MSRVKLVTKHQNNKDISVKLRRFLELCNKTICGDDRSSRKGFIKSYPIDLFSFDKDKHDISNVCVVYHIWDNFAYAKYAYLSILSNYLYTDLDKVDLVIVLSKSMEPFYDLLVPLYQSLGAEVIIDADFRFKYTTVTHIQNNYDLAINVDADTFFFGTKNDIYTQIYNYWKWCKSNNQRFPYLVFDHEYDWSAKKRFELGFKAIDPKRIDAESWEDIDRWYEWWEDNSVLNITQKDLEYWSNQKEWMWNIFSAYDVSFFSSDDIWNEHMFQCQNDLEFWDDEFVFQLYLWKKNLPIQYMNMWENVEPVRPRKPNASGEMIDYFDRHSYKVNNGKTHIIHPIGSHYLNKENMENFFDWIQDRFEIYINGGDIYNYTVELDAAADDFLYEESDKEKEDISLLDN